MADIATRKSRTGGREATSGVIPGRFSLSVGFPPLHAPQGWRWRALSDVAQLESGHTPSRKRPEYWDGGIPWIGIKDAVDGHGTTISGTYQHVSQLGLDNSSARLLPENTVCLSRTASVGYVVVMGCSMATSQDFVNWVCGPELEPHYLKYVLLAEHDSLLQFASGTTHQTIYYPEAKAFHALLPPVAEQRWILQVLERLDDKIELNRRMNETLEEMARALFKSWFVDFDPVRAKAAGREPVGMDAETAKLFPREFEQSELGEIPKGWPVGRLDDLLVLQRGFDLPKNDREPGPFALVTTSGITDHVRTAKVQGPGVVTGRSGQLGIVTFVGQDYWPLNTTLWVKEFRRSQPHHCYFLLKTLGFHQYNSGSAVPTLNRNHVHGIPLVIPSAASIAKYESVVGPLFVAMQHNDRETASLCEIRDALLPRLLSGELSVKHAERILEATA